MHTNTATTQVPFNALRLSPRNVRKVIGKGAASGLQELAASILAEGQLQSLVVTEHQKGKATHYEVEAGGRRLAAMKLLVDDGKWTKTEPVNVTVIPIEQATSASLAENAVRMDMHPADELDAFKKLIDEGKSVEDVAARFGVSAGIVEKRLRLARLAPVFIDEFRADRINLDVLMALTLTEDHETQIAVWKSLPTHSRQAWAIREALTKGELNLKNDAVAKFVGIKAYEKAGGKVRRDLFSEDGDAYLQDIALVQALATEKLEKTATEIQTSEGWSWSLVLLSLNYDEKGRYRTLEPGRREPTKAEAKALKALETERKALQKRDELTDEQEARHEELYDLIADAEDALREYGPKQKAKGGVIVSIGRDGKMEITRGLVRPEDQKAEKKAKGKKKSKGQDGDEGPSSDFSDGLTRSLSAYFTSALQAQASKKPHVVLALLVHSLVRADRFERGELLQIRTDSPNLQSYAEDIETGTAAAALTASATDVEAAIPSKNQLEFLLEQPVEKLLEWLAVLLVPAINAVTGESSLSAEAKLIAKAAGLITADWWTPTAENYFKRVSKDQIVAAAKEGASGDVAKEIAGLPRKGDMVTRAVTALDGKRWIPEFIRCE